MELILVSVISGSISLLVSGAVSYVFKKKNDKYSAELDTENYITKTQFDYEFRMYQDLSLAAFECVSRVVLLFPVVDYIPEDENELQELRNERYKFATEKTNNFTTQLYKSRGFMDEVLFESYNKFLKMCNAQIAHFRWRYSKHYIYSAEDLIYYEKTEEIQNQYEVCSVELRNYLKKIRVLN